MSSGDVVGFQGQADSGGLGMGIARRGALEEPNVPFAGPLIAETVVCPDESVVRSLMDEQFGVTTASVLFPFSDEVLKQLGVAVVGSLKDDIDAPQAIPFLLASSQQQCPSVLDATLSDFAQFGIRSRLSGGFLPPFEQAHPVTAIRSGANTSRALLIGGGAVGTAFTIYLAAVAAYR